MKSSKFRVPFKETRVMLWVGNNSLIFWLAQLFADLYYDLNQLYVPYKKLTLVPHYAKFTLYKLQYKAGKTE